MPPLRRLQAPFFSARRHHPRRLPHRKAEAPQLGDAVQGFDRGEGGLPGPPGMHV